MKSSLLIAAIALFSMPALADELPMSAAPAGTQAAASGSFTASFTDAEDAVNKALAAKGAGDIVSATITGKRTESLFSYTQPLTINVRGLQFDKASGKWNASLLFVSGDDVISALPVSGRFEEMIEVPVLKRQVRSGETISDADIETRRFPLMHTRTDTITDIDKISGKSPLRTISAYRPIREQEIAMPAVVKKNALVTMRYHTDAMEISTSGQAMDNGAVGDVIAVKNLASKKIVRAVIEDNNTVSVASGAQSAQASGDHYAAN